MTDDERELDMALAEAEQENRLLRARNERLEREKQELEDILVVERMAIRDMGHVLSNYEDLLVEMKAKINQLESEQ
jgi:chromosome segregation ATPase